MSTDLFDFFDFTKSDYSFSTAPYGYPPFVQSAYVQGTGFILTVNQGVIGYVNIFFSRKATQSSSATRVVIHFTPDSKVDLAGPQLNAGAFAYSGLTLLNGDLVFDSVFTNPGAWSIAILQNAGFFVQPTPPQTGQITTATIKSFEIHYLDESPFGLPPTIGNSSPSVISDPTQWLSGLSTVLTPFIDPLNQILSQVTGLNATGGGLSLTNLENALGSAVQSLIQPQDTFLSSINDSIKSIVTPLTDIVTQINTASGGAIGDTIQTLLNNIFPQTSQYIQDTIGAIGSLATGTDNQIQTLAGIVQDFIQNQASQANQYTTQGSQLYQGVFSNIIDPIQQWIQSGLNFINSEYSKDILPILIALQQIQPQLFSYFSNRSDTLNSILNNVASGQYTSFDQFYNAFQDKGTLGDFLSFVQNAISLIGLINSIFQARVQPINQQIQYLSNAEFTPNILDTNSAISLWLRGDISDAQRDNILSKHGYSAEVIQQLIYNAEPKFSPDDARQLLWRGKINDLQQGGMLGSLGYSQDNIKLIQTFNQTLLNPQDLIRLGDKHIYSSDIPTIFGQYSEIDAGLVSALSQWGFSEDDIKKLWAGHWSLPSPQLVFEMYQRGQIDDNALGVYLQLTDYLPFFRDKLKNIAYSVISRVDLRRMYHDGVISQDSLPGYYMKMGYSPADASLLADWTIKHDNLSDLPKQVKIRELSEGLIAKELKYGLLDQAGATQALQNIGYTFQDAINITELIMREQSVTNKVSTTEEFGKRAGALILKEYQKQTISAQEAETSLLSLGYDAGTISIELAYSDYLASAELDGNIIQRLEVMYEHRQLDTLSLTNSLSAYGFAGSEIAKIQTRLDTLVTLRFKPISEAKLEHFAKHGIISKDEFINEMQGLGYSDKYIGWFVMELFPTL